jgi:hypothetical protein
MPIDVDYDVSHEAPLSENLWRLENIGLTLIEYQYSGPAGGNQRLLLRGTRAAHLLWLEIYDPDHTSIQYKDLSNA